MSNKKLVPIAIVIILLASNIFFAVKYSSTQKELQQVQAIANAKNTNDKVLNFTKLFVKQVLKAKKEIDFETRLKLENAVRDLNDKKILTQWQKFTESETEKEAQTEVKNLLEMLIDKIE